MHPPGTQPASPPWQNQNSLAEICSLKVVPVGLWFQLRSRKISVLSATRFAHHINRSRSCLLCFGCQPKSTLSESANAGNMIFSHGQNTAANMVTDQRQVLIIQVKIPGNAVFLWFSVCYKASCGISVGVYEHKNPNTMIYGRTES